MSDQLKIPALMSHTELCEAIGKKVARCRKHFRLSRRELAEKSGVSIATIGRLERQGVATISVLVKLANALGVLDSLDGIFAVPAYKSMADYIKAKTL